MHNLSLLISGLMSHMYTSPRVVVRTEIETVVQSDPRGLMKTDVAFMEKHTKPIQWAAGTTVEEVAYQQGQADMIRFVKLKVIGRRLDAPTRL